MKKEKTEDKIKRIATDVGLSMTPTALSTALTVPVIMDTGTNIFKSVNPEELLRRTEQAGSPRVERLFNEMKPEGKPLREYLREKGIVINANMPKKSPGPHFNSLVRTLNLHFRDKASDDAIRGITAHEVGHALRFRNGKASMIGQGLSRQGTRLLGMVLPVWTAHEKANGGTAAALTGLNTLVALPMLREEILASKEGSKLLGLKGLKRLHAFKGVPTYLVAAGAPGIAYGARKIYDRIIDNRKKSIFSRMTGKS